MARIDHTNCTHPRTPAGRSACRRGARAPQVKKAPVVEEPMVFTPMERERFRARSARRAMGTPRAVRRARSDDGVNYDYCVQADLHRGYGACACGWHRGCPKCGNLQYRANEEIPTATNGFCGKGYCHYALSN